MSRARVIAACLAGLALTGPIAPQDAPSRGPAAPPAAPVAVSAAAPVPAPADSSPVPPVAPSRMKPAAVADWLEAHTSELSTDEITAASRTLVEEARHSGLTVGLVLAVIEVESGGDPTARSPAGAIGLMQLRPRTAEETARTLGLVWKGPSSLVDPVVNIRLGVRYLGTLLDRFGDVPGALAAYNWGPGRIARRIARGAPLPAGYVRRVEAAYGRPVERGARSL